MKGIPGYFEIPAKVQNLQALNQFTRTYQGLKNGKKIADSQDRVATQESHTTQ